MELIKTLSVVRQYIMLNLDNRINFILSDIFLVKETGLSFGQMGACLLLANYIRKTQNNKFENIISDLLTYILAATEDRISYNYGEIGIGIGLMNLIGQEMIEADYPEIFGGHHNHIISTANRLNSKDIISDKDCLDMADIMLYMVSFSIFSHHYEYIESHLFRNLFHRIENTIEIINLDTSKYQIMERLIVISELIDNRSFSNNVRKILSRIINKKNEFEKINPPSTLLRLIYLFSSLNSFKEEKDYSIYLTNLKIQNIKKETIDLKEGIDLIMLTDTMQSELNPKFSCLSSEIKRSIMEGTATHDSYLFQAYSVDLLIGLKGGITRIMLYELTKEIIDNTLFL